MVKTRCSSKLSRAAVDLPGENKLERKGKVVESVKAAETFRGKRGNGVRSVKFSYYENRGLSKR